MTTRFRRKFMRLFVTDLDGTLLDSEHKSTELGMETLRKAIDSGIEVCIASGRSYADIMGKISGYGISPYIISSNGASLHDKDGKKLMTTSIPIDEAAAAMKYLEDHSLEFEASTDEYTYVTQGSIDLLKQELEDLGKDSEKREQLYKDVLGLVLSQGNLKIVPTLDDILASIDHANTISSISAYKHKIRSGMDHFSMNKNLLTFSSWKYNFEVTSSKASKGAALKRLCELKGISLDDVAAIGDNYNDTSMIRIAGIKGAMSNSVDQLLKIADYISDDNDHDGVAKFLLAIMDGKVTRKA